MHGRVLIVAGSDSGGGAGIQADIKTVTMLGAYAATAITALTAQNTEGVFGVLPIPPEFIRQQIEVVLDDIGADAIKTGMLHDAAVIEAVAAVLQERAPAMPLVVDPVMVAKGGARLIDPDAIDALKRRLIARATVLTPNLPEAEILCGLSIGDVAAMRRAGESAAGARLPGGAGQGRASRRRHRVGCAGHRRRAPGSGRARGSTPATPTAPAAPSPRRSPPASPRVATSRAPSTARATMCSGRSPAPRASAAATARSTTPTR